MTQLDPTLPLNEQVETLRDDADTAVPSDVRRYYDGQQDDVASAEQVQSLGDRAQRVFTENALKRCVDTITGRLLFRQYLCEDADTVKEWLDTFATKNKIPRQLVATTARVLVDGNHALSLSWDVDPRQGGRAVVHQERWWDGTSGMFVSVDAEGIAEWAVKEWVQRDKVKRRTIYLPDRIIRYIESDGWQPYPDEASFTAEWTKKNGDPLGVPVVHFGNATTTDGAYGQSTLEPLLGLQDALNSTIFDIVAAGALSAAPIYWGTGIDPQSELAVGPGRFWQAASEQAKFGQLPGGSMDALLDSYRAIRSSIAEQFPVPEHLVTGGDWPSGLALTKVESPMIGQVKLLGDTFAPGLVLLAHRATEIANTFDNAGLEEDAMIAVEYAPPEQLDEGTIAEIDRERVGIYRDLMTLPKTLMVKSGLVDDAEADAIIAEMAAQYDVIADTATQEG
jgi:hypothetical protein